jgi:CDP-diglyceride synthetase
MFGKKIWLILIFIVAIYWCTYEGVGGSAFFVENLPARHVLNYILLFSIALGGWCAWYDYPRQWIIKIWSVSYVIIIAGLTIFGIIDIVSKIDNLNARVFISGLRLFFTSPLPYGILMFFAKRAEKFHSP